MTLIRSNPSFKTERAAFFHQVANGKGKSLEAVSEIVRKVDVMANAINEQTGGHIPSEELLLWVIGWINDGDEKVIRAIDIRRLYQEMEDIFLAYPPVIYAADTLSALEELQTKAKGSSFSILSNTAFIKGATLKKVLPALGLGDYFDFQLYSDEAGMSKPNQAFFRQMLEDVTRLRGYTDPGDIVHIGDNPLADVEGASKAGMAQVLVNSNQQSIASLCANL